MKILMIAPQPFYAERGTPMNVRLLCEVLGQNGHVVDLLVFPTGQDIVLHNINIIRVPNIFRVRNISIGLSLVKITYDLLAMCFAAGLVLKNRYQVVHGIEEGGFLAVLIGNLFRIKSIYDMDSLISEQLRNGGYPKRVFAHWASRIEKWAVKRCSLVLTVCRALTDQARAISPGANIIQIEDIAVTDFLEGDKRHAEKVDQLSTELGIKGERVAVYTGNLEGYQGIDLLLDSWAILTSTERTGKLRLLIIGGPWSRVEHYKEVAKKMGIGSSVHWLGQRPAGEMKYWMQIGEVLISPRVQGENTPLKLYSYMASGKPIVATRKKTHTQVLDDCHAFLAPPEPHLFSKAIEAAFSGRDAAVEKGKRAKELAASTFSFEIFTKKLLDAYAALYCPGEIVESFGKGIAPLRKQERG